MKKNSYLVYLINPYNYDKPPKLFLKTNGEQIKEIEFSFLLNNDFDVISYQLEDLFSFIHGIRYEKKIVLLISAKLLGLFMVGHSKTKKETNHGQYGVC